MNLKNRLTGGEIYALHGEPAVRLPAGDVGVLPRLGDVARADGGVAVREAAAEFADLRSGNKTILVLSPIL